ncbi:1-deoxy-D-xylulose-5-phosphate synthase [Psychrobacter piechaudii]|uniref:1-deoxy-D-xylulose-5-phosphate synthase n=1 Tax=Psychrobacter piechaudii TaxID=1945521 RepID=A0A1R4GBU5_9GAMM|nr:1-deoxy-D-xylulose-5-phosphate synthase [Psychrobacter piechaudii]
MQQYSNSTKPKPAPSHQMDSPSVNSSADVAVSEVVANKPAAMRLFSEIPTSRPTTPLLDTIESPADLKPLSQEQLLTLADELREYLLYSAGQSGGHFGANLGVVELTVALHYLLDTPNDKLVWDVGHQAYAHKVLTGRRDRLSSIRSKQGLTAFPERQESEYDTFGVGHSSTSISAGLGMSLALRHLKSDAKVACVIGDGAMTGGMAFEALNDAVQQNADLLVVLNDNDMSISCSIGGFSRHLAMLWESGYQVDITAKGKPKLTHRPEMPLSERRARHSALRDIPKVADNLFKAIGFSYFGPFDGHDLPELLRVLERAKNVSGPVLVHVYTTKGKGFIPAEGDPVTYHAISKLPQPQQQSNESTTAVQTAAPKKKYSQVFGEFLCDKAAVDNKLIAITPAMEEGSGMTEFAKQYPEQFYDVAIAEQHAVTLAAGMATLDIKPIVAIYSTFLQRGYDQLIHDVALQNLDVTFGIDRAGLVGEDGATHAGVFDLAYMRCVPNLVIATPKDENECYHLLNTCYEYKGATAVRYPRGTGPGVEITKPAQSYEVGKAVVEAVYHSQDSASNSNPYKLALLAFGPMVATADAAAKALMADTDLEGPVEISVVNMRWVKPLDTQLIDELIAKGYTHIVTLEEHVVMGGAGSAVNEYLLNHISGMKQQLDIKNIGIADEFIAHGSHDEQLADCGLDVAGVTSQLRSLFTVQ